MLVLLLVALLSLPAVAQQLPKLPLDPKVKMGKLDNGLTYYIQKNTEPKGQANFYIVQKVGSILEEENQRGLAHFLEHMAFNGTKNFPDKTMMNWLEKIGVKFGENLNAGTGFDQTIYNIDNVPVTRQSVVDSCLLILHDWSGFISLNDKEIDNERGVIREEWRTRTNANMRMFETLLPVVFEGSQYAHRLPIGLIDVINNFKYDEIKAYYKKWYRPDLQGIVIVGDIDPDKVEATIKTMFADIPAPVNPAERIEYKVPDNDAPIVSINTDPEATQTQIMVFYKRDIMPKEYRPTAAALVNNYMSTIVQNMLNNRLMEITQKANAPFSYAGVQDGNFFVAQTKDAFMAIAIANKDGVAPGLAAIANEAERARQFGFTPSEYERAKSDFLRAQENIFNDKDKQKSSFYVEKYVENFINGTPAPGIENEYTLYQQLAQALPLEQINLFTKQIIGDKNVAIAIMAPKKEGVTYPTKEEVINIFNKARTENVTAYKEEVSNEPLIAQLPKPGKVTKEEKDAKFDATVWTLSNGIKVVVKKTDFKDDEVMLTASAKGGSSLFDNKDAVNIKVLNDVIELGGIGNFSKINLQKRLAGKQVSASATISSKGEDINGTASPKDLETMMQLVYLTVTAPRMDQEAFQAYLSRQKKLLASLEANPMVALSDTLTSMLYGNHPRSLRVKASMLDKIDYNRIMEMYKSRFADLGDFTFTIVGNVDPATLKPLVEQYIASLPATKKKENFVDVKMYPAKGEVKNHFEKEMQTVKTTVYSIYTGKVDYNPATIIEMSMLDQILDIVYTETIREQEGGTYGVSVRGSVSNYPYGNYQLMIGFDTDPKLRDKLIAKIKEGLNELATVGPKAEILNKVKEFMLKKNQENLRENGYWMNAIDTYYTWNIDTLNDFDKLVNGITIEDIKKFTANIISQKNNVEVVMTGKEKK